MAAVPKGQGFSFNILHDRLVLKAFTILFTILNFGLFNKL